MTKLNVKTVAHTDINEKQQLYLVIENSAGGRVAINIGDKNFTNISKLISDEIQNNSNALDKHGATTGTGGAPDKGKMGNTKNP